MANTFAQSDFDQFIAGVNILHLASTSLDGVPEASYAPCVHLDGIWYVYLSDLAKHTQNILTTGRVSILLIEPAQASANMFALKRVSFDMKAEDVSRETEQWSSVLDFFESRFGAMVAMIRPLSDFHLIALEPISGGFVRGFGQAFILGGEKMLKIEKRRERDNA